MDEEQLLKTMVSMYSPTGKEGQLADFLVRIMKEIGFQSYRDEIGNVIGIAGYGNEDILLVGHIDTVPGELPVIMKKGVLHGRGSVDAKSSLATMICAAQNFIHNTMKRIVVIGTVDEEGNSSGARNLLGKYNPMCIVIGEPSEWDAITIGYKGCLKFTYEIKGGNMHVGTPNSTEIERGIEFWNHVKKYCISYSSSSLFDAVSPKLISFNTITDGLHTCVHMQIDIRIPPSVNIHEVKKSIFKLKTKGIIRWIAEEKSIMSTKNNVLVRTFISAIREEGGTPKLKMKLGTSDMNILGNYWQIPVVAYGPGNSKLDHTPNECICLDDYHKAIRILNNALKKLVEINQ
jgi:LysW-gamma-L-lysine carboxypeptidase